MLFTHDTELALEFMVALADTVPEASESDADELMTPAALVTLLDTWKYSGRRDGDARELAEVRAARDRIRAVWGADDDEVVAWVNRVLSEAHATPRVVDHDDVGWHIHATEPDAPLAERILVEAAMALADVVRADRLDRLRDCEADDCAGVFVDYSKNASRRFCSTRCGNRMAVRAYRSRSRL